MRSAPAPDGITIRTQQPDDLPAMQALIEGAWLAGELAGRSQRDIDRWVQTLPLDPDSAYIAVVDGEIAGFLSVIWSSVIVSPGWRRRGIGRALVATALSAHPDLEMSLPHDNPGAEAFLRATGFRFDHLLRQLQLDPAAASSPPELPDGFVFRPYADDLFDPYFVLVNQAFADHPTPVQVSASRMRAVHARSEFDPTLISLVAKSSNPGDLVAFTFLRSPVIEDGILTGSIGMIGVDRDHRRLGLGRQLLRWGIQRLREAGCERITLEVVDTNERALPLYEQEGFTPVQSWPYWAPAAR
jgi:mycothiol synthase